MWFPNNFNPLKKNEIGGAETLNPMLAWIKNFASIDDFIELNPNQKGSIDISLNAEALKAWLSQIMKLTGESINSHFRCTVSNNTSVNVTQGLIGWDEHITQIAGQSFNVLTEGHCIYLKMTAPTTGAITYGVAPTKVIDLGDDSSDVPPSVNLPIAYTSRNGSDWEITYAHVGDFFFPNLPYIFVIGFDPTHPQSLDHAADGRMQWTTYGECEPQSSSSEEEV